MVGACIANSIVLSRLLSPDKHIENAGASALFVALGVLFFTFGAVLYLKPRARINAVVLFCTIILCIGLIESVSFAVFRFKKQPAEQFIANTLLDLKEDTDMGYVLEPNFVQRAFKKSADGKIFYDVTYTTDAHGRRTTHEVYTDTYPHLILFGCSLTYSEGLNDNETLSHLLARNLPGYNIYNYAVRGYGPQHTLALLESRKLPREVKSSKGVAAYVFTPSHVSRAIGSSWCSWIFGSPYYYLERNGRLCRRGSFTTGRPLITALYKVFLGLKKRLSFLKIIDLNLPFRISKNDIRLTSEIIAESKRLYEQQFDGAFYVIIHPLLADSKVCDPLIAFLKKKNIRVLAYEPIRDSGGYCFTSDGHPNGKLNNILAKKLAKDVKMKGSRE